MAQDKVILLTGASRGMGLAIAHYLLKQKCKLLATARTESALQKLSDEYPGQVEIFAADMSNLETGPEAVQQAVSKFGHLDGVVINHGFIEPVQKIANADVNEWRKSFDIGFFSAVSILKAAIPALNESKGKVVLVSSGAAVKAYSGWGAYGTGKAAINQLTLTLGTEEPDITSFAIRPGVVDTAMQVDIREKHHTTMSQKDNATFAKFQKEGSLLKPEQPGNVIAKLVLDGPKQLSGKFLSWNDEQLADFQ